MKNGLKMMPKKKEQKVKLKTMQDLIIEMHTKQHKTPEIVS